MGRHTLPEATPALLAYLLVRVLGLIVLWLFAHQAGVDFWPLLNGRFDSNWYQQVADQGYDATIPVGPDGTLRPSNLNFFPLYPGLIVLVTALSPIPTAAAALIVSWLAGFAAAWGIYAIGARLHSPQVGVVLATLWGVIPHAVVENMAYTETLFTALAAWTIYALLRRDWLIAGVLCALAGLSRSSAPALIATVAIAALVAVVKRQDGWRPWLATLLAPLGYLGYLAWLAQRLGRIDAYFAVQEQWRMKFDGGIGTARALSHVLTHPSRLTFYGVTLVLALAVVLLVLGLLDRQPLPVLLYSSTLLILTLGTAGEYYFAKGRYLVPAFTLILPVALGLAAARPRTRVVVLVFLALASAWYGAYLCLDWTSSP